MHFSFGFLTDHDMVLESADEKRNIPNPRGALARAAHWFMWVVFLLTWEKDTFWTRGRFANSCFGIERETPRPKEREGKNRARIFLAWKRCLAPPEMSTAQRWLSFLRLCVVFFLHLRQKCSQNIRRWSAHERVFPRYFGGFLSLLVELSALLCLCETTVLLCTNATGNVCIWRLVFELDVRLFVAFFPLLSSRLLCVFSRYSTKTNPVRNNTLTFLLCFF